MPVLFALTGAILIGIGALMLLGTPGLLIWIGVICFTLAEISAG